MRTYSWVERAEKGERGRDASSVSYTHSISMLEAHVHYDCVLCEKRGGSVVGLLPKYEDYTCQSTTAYCCRLLHCVLCGSFIVRE